MPSCTVAVVLDRTSKQMNLEDLIFIVYLERDVLFLRFVDEVSCEGAGRRATGEDYSVVRVLTHLQEELSRKAALQIGRARQHHLKQIIHNLKHNHGVEFNRTPAKII